MQKNRINVLVTGCGGYYMENFLRCLMVDKKIKLSVIGCASEKDPFLEPLLRNYYEVPKSEDKEYISIIYDICKKEAIDIIIPTIDAELCEFARNKKKFEEIGISINLSSIEGIRTAGNKILLKSFLEEKDIPHPETYVVKTIKDFFDKYRVLSQKNKKVVMKLADKAGSRGVRIIDGELDEFAVYANEKPGSKMISEDYALHLIKIKPEDTEIILQEFMNGEEYSVDLLADHGKILAITGRDNIVVDNSIPQISETRMDTEAFSIAEKIVKELKLNGNIGIDYMYHNSEIKVLEINPRVTATMTLSTMAGINLPYLGLRLACGKKIDTANNFKEGVFMCRRKEEYYYGGEDIRDLRYEL